MSAQKVRRKSSFLNDTVLSGTAKSPTEIHTIRKKSKMAKPTNTWAITADFVFSQNSPTGEEGMEYLVIYGAERQQWESGKWTSKLRGYLAPCLESPAQE